MALLRPDGSVFYKGRPEPLPVPVSDALVSAHEAPAPVAARPRPDLVRPLRQVIREHMESALILCAGNHRLAAKRMKISPTTLYTQARAWRRDDLETIVRGETQAAI